ncbi:hypothetical protein AB0K43_11120 [Kitasatospora sp. NPDC049258]|uniref:hypothetical protein n=1 Tax=Kitasatospora sp. NPDC049258 TaxID=3155394 RepID=UPI00343DDCA5
MEKGRASRFGGEDQHGWSPDIDAEHQEPNDSAHRSFHPEKYAPEPGPGRERAAEEGQEVSGNTVESLGRRGEDQGPDKHTYDMGEQGPAGRPSGGRTAEAHTGVDPQEPDGRTSGH